MIYKEKYERLRVIVSSARHSLGKISYLESQINACRRMNVGCDAYAAKLRPIEEEYKIQRKAVVTFLKQNPALDFDLNTLPEHNSKKAWEYNG